MTGPPAPPTRSPAAFPPPTLLVRLQHDVLVRDEGRLLAGGAPFRLTRLTKAGATVVARWRTGGPVGEDPGSRRLARRLLDRGMLVTCPPPGQAAHAVDVVIPVHGRPDVLADCLRSIRETAPQASVLVVDDASPDPHAIARAAADGGARVVRHERCRGPAAARNTGVAHTRRPLIAFVDSDVVVERECLQRLIGHLGDPSTGAVAPRVLASEADAGLLASYEERHSSLDMGPHGASVGPATRVPYVPSTALLVRRSAIPGGFDEGLRVGEDVDFVWRMHADGWRVAYDPTAIVRHAHRTRPVAFVRRRYEYATSIGLLANRHPQALPAVRLDPASLAVVGLLALGRPRAAAAIVAARTVRLRRALRGRTARPGLLACDLTARATVGAIGAAARAARRPWSPPLLLAATVAPRRAGGCLAIAHMLRGLEPNRPSPRHLPIAIADDLLAGIGTWAGCVRRRTARPLLPAITSSQRRGGSLRSRR